MLKQIQLRGISRNPSDRMTADGGVAESLNFQIDQDENAPVLDPEDVTQLLGLGETVSDDILYIHKTSKYTNYIVQRGQEIGFIRDGVYSGVFTLDTGVVVRKVVSLGNILGIITSQNVKWMLYQYGKYTPYENDIPFPSMSVYAKPYSGADNPTDWETDDPIKSFVIKKESSNTGGERSSAMDNRLLDDTYEDEKDVVEDNTNRGYDGVTVMRYYTRDSMLELSGKIKEALSHNLKLGYFNNQFLAVYAIKLYDDSRIISNPILVSPGYEFPYDIKCENSGIHRWEEWYAPDSGQWYDEETWQMTSKTTVNFNSLFRLCFKLNEEQDFFSLYGDIVKSVEVYVTPRAYYQHYRELRGHVLNYTSEGPEKEESEHKWTISFDESYKLEFGSKGDTYEKELNNLSLFYKVKEYEINNETIADLIKGIEIDDPELIDEETFVAANDRVDMTSDMTHYTITYNNAIQYNNMILASQVSQIVKLDINTFPAIGTRVVVNQADFTDFYRLTFHIKDDNGKVNRVRAFFNGQPYLECKARDYHGVRKEVDMPFSYIVCPDPRAYKVDVFVSRVYSSGTHNIKVGHFDMVKHPRLNYSYYYGGLDVPLMDSCSSIAPHYIEGMESYVENLANKLFVSKMDSPFVFPLNSRYTFSDELVGVAIATAALSPGQQGQFPVYVFTEGGVWTMETNSEGSFVSSKPLNRHVAISSSLITPLDNAVLFMTKEGLYVMQGSELVNISENMNGQHWSADASVVNVINAKLNDFKQFIPVLEDEDPFMTFLKDGDAEASVTYDYVGKRLIFFRNDKQYAYVYKLNTSSWHKISIPEGMHFARVLNSYPSSQVVLSEHVVTPQDPVDPPEYTGTSVAPTEGVIDSGVAIDKVTIEEIERDPEFTPSLPTDGPLVEKDPVEWIEEMFPTLSGGIAQHDLDDDDFREAGERYHVYDFSTALDNNPERMKDMPIEAVIATRPFDLEASDILKTITHLKVRGAYERNDVYGKRRVQYMLLGSQDGVNFHLVGSLRGKSWKMFRVIILAKLRPYERISWIDVEYETKFTNKIR